MTLDVTELIAALRLWPGEAGERSLIIGIGGGSGSGKTTIARSVLDVIGDDVIALIPHDAYYRDQAHLSFEERTKINYDHPDSLENELLVSHLEMLRAGRAVQRPLYDFTTHTRTAETVPVEPHRVVMVEGILVLAAPELRELFDLRIYIDTDADLRLLRRLQRDMIERGRTIDSVLAQYQRTVRPMHLQFVEPSKRYADIIFPEGYNPSAIGTVTAMIRHVLAGS